MLFKHGHTSKKGKQKTPEYHAWANARSRCHNPNDPGFYNYGGRGILMCEEWQVDFRKFLDHIGLKPANTSLDRIDNNRGYEPGNVRWATAEQQFFNRKGCYRTLADYKKYYDLHQSGLSYRKIGEIFGINYGNIGFCVKRYKRHLKEQEK